MIEPKFKPYDYVINRASGDLAIIKGITKKGYYEFNEYYDNMFHQLKDLKNLTYNLQVNYQKFWDICTDEEKNKFEKIIKEKGGN